LKNPDFTYSVYQILLPLLKRRDSESGDAFVKNKQFIALRHDIDRRPENALKMARMEAEMGVMGIYFFRTRPHVFKPEIIKEIADMGHEIGYHYENLADCMGNMELAIKDFERNLGKLRQIVPIKSICMHGSPLSKFDNRDLWKQFDYQEFGIDFEPYFDVDFSEVFYLTDTGRCWDGAAVSVRDRVDGGAHEWPVYHTTWDIIRALEEGTFPLPAMITIHPQRWSDNIFSWTRELVSQNVKNMAKRVLVRNST